MGTISSKDNISDNSYPVFFDLDRTLIKTISGKALVVTAFRKGLITGFKLTRIVYLLLAHRFRLKDPLKIINNMLRWIKDMPENIMADLCSESFNKLLLPSILQDARSEIKFHKSRNAKTIILSSSISSICRDMARSLEMDDIICSDLEVLNGYYTGNPQGNICYGNEKAVRLKAYCEINNSTPQEAWYYGDSISDLPVLNLVGHPVCINPDPELKKTARRNGWEIKNWK
ncbi:MAG TPA: HAD-IB family hydrolase [Bacteroidales bacterium]|nr:HAD-IB family hydrolase [Bacteroidales bacterium]